MIAGDARRRMVLRRIQLQDRLRQFDYESNQLRQAIAKTRSSGDRLYRAQIARELTARLNAILREKHAVDAKITSCERELAR